MAVIMFGRWRENKNTASITFKKYEQTPEDKYPTFSICFQGTGIHSYNDSLIFETYEVTSDQYRLMLEGRNTSAYYYEPALRFYKKRPPQITETFSGDVEGMMQRAFNVKDILVQAQLVRKDKGHGIYYEQSSGEQPPLYIDYEVPEKICFTRESKSTHKSSRLYDKLVFNQTFLQKGISEDSIIQIFIHYPNQLFRSLDKPSFSLPIFKYDVAKDLQFKLSQGTVLRKRPDSNEPCDNDIKNYDAHLQQHITNETGCIYPPWKSQFKGTPNLDDCKTPEDIKRVIDGIERYNKISCVDMFKSVAWNWVDEDDFGSIPNSTVVRFEYIDDYFQEIEYLVSFDGESLISNLGGFIGIFLGYSMMQFPELVGMY